MSPVPIRLYDVSWRLKEIIADEIMFAATVRQTPDVIAALFAAGSNLTDALALISPPSPISAASEAKSPVAAAVPVPAAATVSSPVDLRLQTFRCAKLLISAAPSVFTSILEVPKSMDHFLGIGLHSPEVHPSWLYGYWKRVFAEMAKSIRSALFKYFSAGKWFEKYAHSVGQPTAMEVLTAIGWDDGSGSGGITTCNLESFIETGAVSILVDKLGFESAVDDTTTNASRALIDMMTLSPSQSGVLSPVVQYLIKPEVMTRIFQFLFPVAKRVGRQNQDYLLSFSCTLAVLTAILHHIGEGTSSGPDAKQAGGTKAMAFPPHLEQMLAAGIGPIFTFAKAGVWYPRLAPYYIPGQQTQLTAGQQPFFLLQNKMPTTCGPLFPPLGAARFKLMEFLLAACRVKSAPIHAAFIKALAPELSVVIDTVHAQIAQVVILCDACDACDAVERIVHAICDSNIKPLQTALINKLVPQFVLKWKEFVATAKAGAANRTPNPNTNPRPAYFGHFLRLWLAVNSASQTNPELNSVLQSVSDGKALKDWNEISDSPEFKAEVATGNLLLGGEPFNPKVAKKSAFAPAASAVSTHHEPDAPKPKVPTGSEAIITTTPRSPQSAN